MTTVKIINPTGHLATVPFEEESFWKGVEREPDFICADSGSNDIGPQPFGSDTSISPASWQKHDLELMLRASRELDVPMIVGSAADTGTDRGVDQFVEFIHEIAAEQQLDEFKLSAIYSEVTPEVLVERIDGGEVVEGLNGRQSLTRETVDNTEHVLAAMGVDPYIEALEAGADVIIAGRSVDAALFAAPAIWSGIPENVAYISGKIMECASLLAEPFAGKETVLGTLTEDDVVFEAMSDYQRVTPESLANHAMYERADPFIETVPRGELNMQGCDYISVDDERARVTGAEFTPAEQQTIKLEGAGKVGERYMMITGIRDPYIIDNLDEALEMSRDNVEKQLDVDEYELHYHVYGQDGVMGDFEPSEETPHEVGIVVEGIAPTAEDAEEVTMRAGMSFFYLRLPEIKGTGGTAAFISDEAMPAQPAYTWSINHVIDVDDPVELQDIEYHSVGGGSA